jgi:hypothetical protein
MDVAALLQFADQEKAAVPATHQTRERELVLPLPRLARHSAIEDCLTRPLAATKVEQSANFGLHQKSLGDWGVAMTIHHRLNLSADLAGPMLQAVRVPFPENPAASGRIVISDISEDNPAWPGSGWIS